MLRVNGADFEMPSVEFSLFVKPAELLGVTG